MALINARLAPDMFTLAQQIQQACYYAANDASRLSGRGKRAVTPAGSTFAELKCQIQEAIRFVSAIKEDNFAEAGDRDCSIELADKMTINMQGAQFLCSWSLPHFYFHVVTTYDILRHNGVEVGKRDYVSEGLSNLRV